MRNDLDSLDSVLCNQWHTLLWFQSTAVPRPKKLIWRKSSKKWELREGFLQQSEQSLAPIECAAAPWERAGTREASNTNQQQLLTPGLSADTGSAANTYCSHHSAIWRSRRTLFNHTNLNTEVFSVLPDSYRITNRGWEWMEGFVQLRTEVCDMLDCWVTLPVGEVHCLPPDRLA